MIPTRIYVRPLLAAILVVALSHGGLTPAWSQATNAVPAAPGPVVATALTGEQALQRLMEGNARYVAGQSIHPDQTTERRAALAGGQAPFAIVLTCSDSRVSPELFFDQGLGDLFVIRNAGNVLDDHVIGSMEYAVEHLHVPLIIVVGHGEMRRGHRRRRGRRGARPSAQRDGRSDPRRGAVQESSGRQGGQRRPRQRAARRGNSHPCRTRPERSGQPHPNF